MELDKYVGLPTDFGLLVDVVYENVCGVTFKCELACGCQVTHRCCVIYTSGNPSTCTTTNKNSLFTYLNEIN